MNPRKAVCHILILLCFSAVGAGCSAPRWYLDPTFGTRLADQEKKPILFYFKEWDSTQHRNMRVQVLDSAAVQKELLDTINIELEFAWSDPYRKIYGVQKPQVCVMCDSDGNKVGSGLYVNPVPTQAKFLEWLRECKALAKPAGQPTTPAAAK